MDLWVDLETRCRLDLKQVGLHKYAETAEILLNAYAWNAMPPTVEEIFNRDEMQYAVNQATRVCAQNAEFDCTILERHDVWVPFEKRYCTMAQAHRHGLPGGLEKLCQIFRIEDALKKQADGRELILLFCKPRKDGSWATAETHPNEWVRFKRYAGSDILAMRAVHNLMPKWNDPYEREIYALDQSINRAGFNVDLQLARGAVVMMETEKARLKGEVQQITLWDEDTGAGVESATQRDKLLEYILSEHDVNLPDMQASTLEHRLNDENLPDEVRQLIGLRLESSKTSNGKYSTLLKRISSDGRLRGWATICGAHRTMRWSAKGFQPHNLPRLQPGITPEIVDYGVHGIRDGWLPLVNTLPLSKHASLALRGCVVASHGHILNIGDYSNIEGRGIAFLACEEWKLQAFRDYDAGIGPDLYNLSYARAFNIDPARVDGFQRQIGKVMELFLGYEGGVGAFVTGSKTYRIDLAALADAATPLIPDDIYAKAEAYFEKEESRGGYYAYELGRDVFIALDSLKRMWRLAHPAIEAFWKALADAVRIAITTGASTMVGRVFVTRTANWLRLVMPSGRSVSYPSPRVDLDGTITFAGVSPYTHQWGRVGTYGGKLAENCTQFLAREFLVDGMLNAADDGHNITLHVHDEIVADDDPSVPLENLKQAMLRPRTHYSPHPAVVVGGNVYWAEGMPLAVKVFQTDRWKKEA